MIAQFMGNGRFMVPATIYALVMNVSVLILIAAGNKLSESKSEVHSKS